MATLSERLRAVDAADGISTDDTSDGEQRRELQRALRLCAALRRVLPAGATVGSAEALMKAHRVSVVHRPGDGDAMSAAYARVRSEGYAITIEAAATCDVVTLWYASTVRGRMSDYMIGMTSRSTLFGALVALLLIAVAIVALYEWHSGVTTAARVAHDQHLLPGLLLPYVSRVYRSVSGGGGGWY